MLSAAIAMTVALKTIMVVRAMVPGVYEMRVQEMATLVEATSAEDVAEMLQTIGWIDEADEAMAKEAGQERTFQFLGLWRDGEGATIKFSRQNPRL